jgi:uncharacterized repeat protein (TIGR01451 family)
MLQRITTTVAAVLLLSAAVPVAGCGLLSGGGLLSVTQVDLAPKAAVGTFKQLEITVSNSAAGVARGVSIRDRLPNGFAYVSTSSSSGDAIRTLTLDPPINSPTPQWGTWSIPAGTVKHPATLVLDFTVAVGRAPSPSGNLVEVSSDGADPVAAKALPLSVQPTAVIDLQVGSHTPVKAGGTTGYTIQLRNAGSAPARTMFVSAALPPGFIYAGTVAISGNSLRESATDPIADSLLPSWGTWSMPPVQLDGSVGVLKISFDVRVVADEPAGSYPISITVTYNGLPAQTISDQAAVTVTR